MEPRKFIREFLEILVEAKLQEKKKRKKRNIIQTPTMQTPTGSIFYLDFATSENELREIIRRVLENEIGGGMLCEGVSGRSAAKPLTSRFDHLKWKLTASQKYFLDDFVDIHPDILKEQDYSYASRQTGIPIENLKSIQNTYGSWNQKKAIESVDLSGSRFEINSKNALRADDYQIPQKYRHDVVNFKKLSKEEADALRYPKKTLAQRQFESGLNKATGGGLKRSNISEEVNYDDWMMYFLSGKLNPKDSRMNSNKRLVEIDFEVESDNRSFERAMLDSNKKSPHWIEIEKLINEFNNIFKTNYIVVDQIDLSQSRSKCLRIVVSEIKIKDKMFWDDVEKKYIPIDQASEAIKKQYVDNRPENRTKEISQVDFEELVKKYKNFDSSMFRGI